MQTTFTVRPFKPADLEQVIDLNLKCLPENYTNFFFMDLYDRFPEAFIVAEENGKVIGYIMSRIEIGLSSFHRFGIAKKGHVISIAVLPEHRRKGIGEALMQEALRAMLRYKAKECFLEVRVGNTPAVNLYKKLDFKVIRTIGDYYADGEDAYVMNRKIQSDLNP